MSFKNTVISSLKTVISTVILVLANIVAIVAVDYISADFTVGPLYNVLLIIIAFTVANAILWPIFRRFLMKYIILTFGIVSSKSGGFFISAVRNFVSVGF